MGKNDKVTSVDKQWIQDFINNDVGAIIAALKRLQTVDNPADYHMKGPTLASLLGSYRDDVTYYHVKPLAIGYGAEAGAVGGDILNGAAADCAKKTISILNSQETLWADIRDNLNTALTQLFTAKNDNLHEIKGQPFLDVLADVANDIGGTSAGSGGGSGGGGGGSGA